MHLQVVGSQKHSDFPQLLSAIPSASANDPYEPPETFTTEYFSIIYDFKYLKWRTLEHKVSASLIGNHSC